MPAHCSQKLGGSNYPGRPVLCPPLTHQGKPSPKTKQPVHRSDLTFH